MAAIGDVLDFWFAGDPSVYRPAWFTKDAAYDDAIRDRFRPLWEEARSGACGAWSSTPAGALALAVVLDQFPRNMFRGTAMAYASDSLARDVARGALARGFDLLHPPVARWFLYLPYEHSEDAADQESSVRLFGGLAFDPVGARAIESAHRHREIVVRFGRFPHRNVALGRATTAEEAVFLTEPNSSF